MKSETGSRVTAALTFKVPQKIGWSVQCEDQSWNGNELHGLIDCLADKSQNNPITLSLSLIFELTGNEGTVRSHSEIPPRDER